MPNRSHRKVQAPHAAREKRSELSRVLCCAIRKSGTAGECHLLSRVGQRPARLPHAARSNFRGKWRHPEGPRSHQRAEGSRVQPSDSPPHFVIPTGAGAERGRRGGTCCPACAPSAASASRSSLCRMRRAGGHSRVAAEMSSVHCGLHRGEQRDRRFSLNRGAPSHRSGRAEPCFADVLRGTGYRVASSRRTSFFSISCRHAVTPKKPGEALWQKLPSVQCAGPAKFLI